MGPIRPRKELKTMERYKWIVARTHNNDLDTNEVDGIVFAVVLPDEKHVCTLSISDNGQYGEISTQAYYEYVEATQTHHIYDILGASNSGFWTCEHLKARVADDSINTAEYYASPSEFYKVITEELFDDLYKAETDWSAWFHAYINLTRIVAARHLHIK